VNAVIYPWFLVNGGFNSHSGNKKTKQKSGTGVPSLGQKGFSTVFTPKP
jgi:hypothetical protein